MSRKRRRLRITFVLGCAAALVGFLGGVALAAPPAALPANADSFEQTFQPAYDYDTDGCYPTPAIGPTGVLNGGLNPSGALNGQCHDTSDLDNTNGYSRYKCNNGWCAIIYGLYFEKDQATVGGHRHDWEHVVVWVQNNQAQYVSTSAHGNFNIYPSSQIRWEGTHPKIVYHKDGLSTHCFRPANSGDEPPENAYHTWQYPDLVGWNGYPAGIRDTLSGANWGSAVFGLKDGNFNNHLALAKPAGIAFDPNT
ncbi:Necrosis inducing protein (NPP1) [Parafrankia irregularis]|uniref:Necrosis inducing protein (NPP1) n=1 Tax=Parafrankia irregularis TaxID=795642 RepID=A0A0S4QND3_9ACTN|nr:MULTISPECIES: NPP1 family protein [Parafrankia]MBE3200639.1 NPP1 family protein [Parafrankia sp. CH37]CUU56973.1 Necrosis inducing protein (NPP1) [Parafrankia irregularis]